ncbi:MAG: FAD:protein FMN transferase [Vicinamibacteria bacterium]|nr:FAD:protein FMN transferase [Vicinamibacteria bacterium]
MTTPDQLSPDTDDPGGPARDPWAGPRRRSRRAFWRPRPSASPGAFLRIFRQAMACRFQILLPAAAGTDIPAACQALGHADRLEQAWSVFRDDSHLSHINRAAAGGPCALDDELGALLRRCDGLSAATDGAFDITATPLSRCWRLLQREGRMPSPEAIAEARARTGRHLVEIRGRGGRASALQADGAGGWTIRFTRPGVELNLGAIGKGYAVSCIAAHLRQAGVAQALVSSGDSSVEAVGAPQGGWPIALRGHDAGVRLWLRHGALATSGASEQGFEHNGVRLGHVLDPRTGWPARGVSRVAVAAPDAADADALATAFFVGGPALADRYLADHDDVLAVFTLDASPRPHIMGRTKGASVEA